MKSPLLGWKHEHAEALKTTDDVDTFNTIEREAILSACNDLPYRHMVEFAFWTGLRTSEIVALTWEEIDWLRGEARINKATTQFAKKPEPPKTRKSIRNVKRLGPALEALKRQKTITFLQGSKVARYSVTQERARHGKATKPSDKDRGNQPSEELAFAIAGRTRPATHMHR